MSNQQKGIVYILINEAMPGYIKIGMTCDSLEKRIRSLDTTGTPLPFECFYAREVENVLQVERTLHDAFADNRVRSNREFFEISPERVVSALTLAPGMDVTPGRDYVETEEDQKALNQARIKRERFSFKIVDIPMGAEISFARNPNIMASVVNNKQIKYNGTVTSLTAAAKDALSADYALNGALYWMYEGETLDERRKRLEEEE